MILRGSLGQSCNKIYQFRRQATSYGLVDCLCFHGGTVDSLRAFPTVDSRLSVTGCLALCSRGHVRIRGEGSSGGSMRSGTRVSHPVRGPWGTRC